MLSEERYEVVVSAFSDTGLEVARQLFPDVTIVRYPFDFAPIVARFWRRIWPDHVLLMELEAWPCFQREANRRGAPVAVVSGRITEESFRRYRMFGSLPEFGTHLALRCTGRGLRRALPRPRPLGGRVVVTGNVKIDGLRRLEASESDPALESLRWTAGLSELVEPPLVIVAGSTHEPEEALPGRVPRRGPSRSRLVIVPRHPERGAGVATELAGSSPVPALSCCRSCDARARRGLDRPPADRRHDRGAGAALRAGRRSCSSAGA